MGQDHHEYRCVSWNKCGVDNPEWRGEKLLDVRQYHNVEKFKSPTTKRVLGTATNMEHLQGIHVGLFLSTLQLRSS